MIMNIEKKWIIKDYIKNNPNCTYLDIKRDTKIKVERFYRSVSRRNQWETLRTKLLEKA